MGNLTRFLKFTIERKYILWFLLTNNTQDSDSWRYHFLYVVLHNFCDAQILGQTAIVYVFKLIHLYCNLDFLFGCESHWSGNNSKKRDIEA